MPIWILVALISMGEPHAFKFEIIDHFDTYKQCLKALDHYEYKHPAEQLACGEIE